MPLSSSNVRLVAAALASTLVACTVTTGGGTPTRGSGTGTASGDTSGASGSPGSSAAPSALVGTWTAGRGGTTVSYDTITDTSSPSNASGLAFQFAADGTFAKAYRDSNGGTCPAFVLATESGTVAWGESDLELHSEHGTFQTWSACGGGVASQPMGESDLDRARYTFALDGDALVLTRASDGASAQFQRAP